jgi:hypothetical protein
MSNLTEIPTLDLEAELKRRQEEARKMLDVRLRVYHENLTTVFNKLSGRDNLDLSTEEILAAFAPEHSRTSCSDVHVSNGFESGIRCQRCTLIQALHLPLPDDCEARIVFRKII